MPNSLQTNRKKFLSLQSRSPGFSSLQPPGSSVQDLIKRVAVPGQQSRAVTGPIQPPSQTISKPSPEIPSGNTAATTPRSQFVQQQAQQPAQQTFTTPSGATGSVAQLQALGGQPSVATPQTTVAQPVAGPVAASVGVPAAPTREPVSKSQELRDFISTLARSERERELQERIANVQTGTQKGIQDIGQQTIPLQFITGQQRAVEQRGLAQAGALQSELERLTGQRAEESSQRRFLLDIAQQEQTGAEEARRFDVGQQNIQTEQALAQRKFEEGVRQFGVEQQGIDTQIVQARGRSLLVNSQTGKEIRDLGATEGALARFAQASKDAADAKDAGEDVSPFLRELGKVATTNISDLKTRVAVNTVGLGALTSIKIPASKAFDFAADLEVLKADIGFGILQQMREASKTGGALGQVSERELAFLQATLGSLNQLQSAANFNKNLDRVQESVNRWTSAVETSGGGTFTTAGGNQVTITETK